MATPALERKTRQIIDYRPRSPSGQRRTFLRCTYPVQLRKIVKDGKVIQTRKVVPADFHAGLIRPALQIAPNVRNAVSLTKRPAMNRRWPLVPKTALPP